METQPITALSAAAVVVVVVVVVAATVALVVVAIKSVAFLCVSIH